MRVLRTRKMAEATGSTMFPMSKLQKNRSRSGSRNSEDGAKILQTVDNEAASATLSNCQLEHRLQCKIFPDLRCGEISISLAIPTLTLHCIFCAFEDNNLESFLAHLQIEHLHELQPITDSWPDKPPLEPEIKLEETTELDDAALNTPDNAADPLLPEDPQIVKTNVILKCETEENDENKNTEFDEHSDSTTNRPGVQKICRILHHFREHPKLWNTQLYAYYVKSEQQTALQSIVSKLIEEYPTWEVDIKYVNSKINHFKSIYRYYNNGKKPLKWTKNDAKYYELLHFLEEHAEKRKSSRQLCKLCNKEVHLLSKHMLKHHRPSSTNHKCNICFELLNSEKYLEKHLRREHKHFKCQYCDQKAYSNSKSLREHEIIHHPEHHPEHSLLAKRAICEYCGRIFNRPRNLYKHKKIVHLQNCPYACIDCPKKFKTSEKLKSHRNSQHLNLRCHVCDVCGKGFFDRKTMVQHKQLHSDVKHYVCRVCSKGFRQAPALHSHMKTHA